MAEYQYQLTANIPLLDETIGSTASFSDDFDGVRREGPDVTIVVSRDLTVAEQDELDAIIDAHDPAGLSVDQRIDAARNFGIFMIEKWQRIIMLDGVIQAGKAHDVAVALDRAAFMARLGNLYALDVELAEVVTVPTFLDAARITLMRNDVRAYLGLPPV